MADDNQLLVPDVAKADPHSFELLRVWVANKGQHVSLRTAVWENPAAWGVMLTDLARHIPNAYNQDSGIDQEKVLQRIKQALDGELVSPTDKVTGKFQANTPIL